MPFIRTVLGDITPDQLGVCYPHEHLLGHPPPHLAEPDLMLTDEEAAVRELRIFHDAGGRAMVDMSTPDYGRNAEGLRRISEQTGVHIISATGYNKDKFSAQLARDRTVQELANEFVRDVLVGMDGTNVLAGVLKASSTLNSITPHAEKVFQAVAQAHHRTGAPISTHTEAGTMALEQVALLRTAGVDPGRVIIGHVDRRLEWDFLLQLAKTGVFLSFDQISKEKYYPDILRADGILRLCAEGYGSRILLSGDLARRSYWQSYGMDGSGFGYILRQFVPLLRQKGLSGEEVDGLLVRNPATALQCR